MKPLDSTKELISDIISWEKDLSQYESLESILRSRFVIQKRESPLKPIAELTDSDILQLCSIAAPLPFIRHTKNWKIERKKHNIFVSKRFNTHSFSIDLANGDLDCYVDEELSTTDNQAQIVKWYSDNNFDVLTTHE